MSDDETTLELKMSLFTSRDIPALGDVVRITFDKFDALTIFEATNGVIAARAYTKNGMNCPSIPKPDWWPSLTLDTDGAIALDTLSLAQPLLKLREQVATEYEAAYGSTQGHRLSETMLQWVPERKQSMDLLDDDGVMLPTRPAHLQVTVFSELMLASASERDEAMAAYWKRFANAKHNVPQITNVNAVGKRWVFGTFTVPVQMPEDFGHVTQFYDTDMLLRCLAANGEKVGVCFERPTAKGGRCRTLFADISYGDVVWNTFIMPLTYEQSATSLSYLLRRLADPFHG